ncbi:MAG: phosphoribosylglycinamide formyltransferase [Chitinophagaceae bacterium]
MQSLIIFASGNGSNAQAIISYFKEGKDVEISLIVSNKSDAGVLQIANEENIPSLILTKAELSSADTLERLQTFKPTLIVLAGFLLKIPASFVAAFPRKIINIHPALLPSFGGKGMWGHHVHQAVIDAQETQSGITIHTIDEVYDRGEILLQARCEVLPTDDASSLAAKVQKLEHYFFPRTLDFLLQA